MVIDFLLDDIRKAIAGIEDEVSGLTAESFASVDYVSSAKTIYFYNAVDEQVGSIDTTDFVVDGMIDTVNLSGNVLHFVFNTDAGKQPIDVDLSTVMPSLDEYWTSAQTKDYVDTAVSGIDLSNYYTKAETDSAITAVENHIYDVEEVTASAYTELHDDILELSARTVDLSGYYTSAQTEEAISAATAGKADAASTQANTGGLRFPLWNAQGVITGRASSNEYHMAGFGVNGSNYNIIKYGSTAIPGIFAPNSAGTAGEVLVSTGNGAPVWSAVTIPDMSLYTPTSGFSTINGSAITNGGNIVIQGGGGGDLSNYWTSAETKTYVDSADTALQDQIDTMDDVVSAALVNLNDTKVGSADVKTIVKLTQAEYEALTVKDPYTFYIIIDNS